MPGTGDQNAPQAAPSPWLALPKASGVQLVSSKLQGAFVSAILFGALSARNIWALDSSLDPTPRRPTSRNPDYSAQAMK